MQSVEGGSNLLPYQILLAFEARRDDFMRRILIPAIAAFVSVSFSIGLMAAEVPPPESALGFKPGTDSQLAGWSQVVTYFKAVDTASDRVSLRVLGDSTEGRPYLAAIISSP